MFFLIIPALSEPPVQTLWPPLRRMRAADSGVSEPLTVPWTIYSFIFVKDSYGVTTDKGGAPLCPNIVRSFDLKAVRCKLFLQFPVSDITILRYTVTSKKNLHLLQVSILIFEDNNYQSSKNPAIHSASWPLTAAKAATGFCHMLSIIMPEMIC